MSTFAPTFRELIIPDLRRLARAQGLFVALGLDTWANAYERVHAHARSRGALHLPDSVHADLEDWITTELLRAIDAAASAAEPQPIATAWRTILERPWPTTT